MQASTALRSGTITSEALVRQALSRKAAAISAKLNCFMDDSEPHDVMLRRAMESDARRSQGRKLGALDGVPFTVKDNFSVSGSVTSAASNILASFQSPYTARCVSNLLDQGAVLIGRTNMDEFGMGSASAFSRAGAVVNPYSPRVSSPGGTREELTAGGSSGGGAAAVAWGAGTFAVGSDTGGSVRQPAAFCGVVGFKPSYGYVSRHGLVAYASSLDCPGVMAASVGDAALAVLCMGASGADTDDRYAKHIDRLDGTKDIAWDLKGVVIGVPEEYNLPELDLATVNTWKVGLQWLQDAGL
jgi:aspartyl-tRNA(Asn)/glutamyl-tRNA(Gln) amidotransferase subunit A